MNFDDVLPSFVAEASELLREMEDGLLQCTRGTPRTRPSTSSSGRAHTIKGSAGLFGLDAIVSFVHGVETLLDRVRLGEVTLDSQLVQVAARPARITRRCSLLALPDAKHGVDPALLARSAQLLSELGESAGAVKAAAPVAVAVDRSVRAAWGWRVSLRFSPDVLMAGMDPLAFIKYLTTFGTISELALVDDELPRLSKLDPHKCYLGFELELLTAEGRERRRSRVRIRQRRLHAEDRGARCGCAKWLRPRLRVARLPAPRGPRRSRSLPRGGGAAGAAAAEGGARKQAAVAAESTVRVDANKLDSLITRIGELIIAAAGANMAARRSGSVEVEEQVCRF